jgi:hypothetical protein
MSERPALSRFKDNVCSFRPFFFHLLAMQVAILVILLFSLAVLNPSGDADYLLLTIDLAILSVTLGGTLGAIYACRDH